MHASISSDLLESTINLSTIASKHSILSLNSAQADKYSVQVENRHFRPLVLRYSPYP